MKNTKELNLELTNSSDMLKICALGKALAIPERIKILQLLQSRTMNLLEIARTLDLPVSSVSNHVNALADAELIIVNYQPGPKGHVKMCSQMVYKINIGYSTPQDKEDSNAPISYEMPVGMYSSCNIYAPCGMAGQERQLFAPDNPSNFYSAERSNADLLWFSYGSLTYNFPNIIPQGKTIEEISFSMEICSEAIYYRNVWPSDITLHINGKEITTWTSPGDFGGRRGIYTPAHWPTSSTQFGLLKKFSVTKHGVFIDDVLDNKAVRLQDLHLGENKFISLTIEIKENARHRGGINIFGKQFGDYPQSIVMSVK